MEGGGGVSIINNHDGISGINGIDGILRINRIQRINKDGPGGGFTFTSNIYILEYVCTHTKYIFP